MSAKNYYVNSTDPDYLKTLEEDYQRMGRDTKIDGNTLTVYAVKQKPVTPKKKFVKKPRRQE